MHPGMMWWWKNARRQGCGREGAYAGESGWQAGPWRGGSGDDFGGGSFGVRRPLRFLAYKLNLSEEQVSELAKILDELKTERAQAAVDDRRTVAAFADALGLDAFDEAAGARGRRPARQERGAAPRRGDQGRWAGSTRCSTPGSGRSSPNLIRTAFCRCSASRRRRGMAACGGCVSP